MQLVVVSPMMTATESSGHFYWAYKKMREATKNLGMDSISIAAEGQIAEGIHGLLKRKTSHHNYYSSFDQKTVNKISNLVNQLNLSDGILFHFYDGGLGDLILVSRIMRIYPKSVVLLNLHWSDSIATFLNEKNPLSMIEKICIKRILLAHQHKMILMAESESLSEICRTNLAVEITEYPVFSVYDPKPYIEKSNDILLVTYSEIEFQQIYKVVNDLANELGILSLTILTNNESRKKILDGFIDSGKVKIEIIDRVLNSEDYETLHRKTKSVVLPYNQSFYKLGSSGRLLDAYNFGCNVVVPRDLELSKKSEQLGIGYSYERENHNSILNSIRDSIKNVRSSPLRIDAPTVENALRNIQSAYESKINSGNNTNRSRYPLIELILFEYVMKLKWSIMLRKDFLMRIGYGVKSKIRT